MKNIQNFLDRVIEWAEEEENILALGLVGSYARNNPKPDSDVDLMFIAKKPSVYLSDNKWIIKFGEIEKVEDEVWGRVKTKRVFYANGLEVEFNFDNKGWADPKDSGTQRVVGDGMKILVDKEGILEELEKSFKSKT